MSEQIDIRVNLGTLEFPGTIDADDLVESLAGRLKGEPGPKGDKGDPGGVSRDEVGRIVEELLRDSGGGGFNPNMGEIEVGDRPFQVTADTPFLVKAQTTGVSLTQVHTWTLGWRGVPKGRRLQLVNNGGGEAVIVAFENDAGQVWHRRVLPQGYVMQVVAESRKWAWDWEGRLLLTQKPTQTVGGGATLGLRHIGQYVRVLSGGTLTVQTSATLPVPWPTEGEIVLHRATTAPVAVALTDRVIELVGTVALVNAGGDRWDVVGL